MVLSMNLRNFTICANVFQLCQGTVHLHNLCQFLYIDLLLLVSGEQFQGKPE